MKTLTIGRADTNNLVIKHSKISNKHCEIQQIEDDTFIIEDLGSTNCTYLNGKRIKQSLLKSDDKLQLADFEINLSYIFGLFASATFPVGLLYEKLITQELEQQKRRKILDDFQKLKIVYENYFNAKKKIITGNTLKNTGLRVGFALIPFIGDALGTLTANVTGKVQEKMLDLDEQFKKDYICPACFRYLDAEPFENLEKREACSYCGCRWIVS